MSWMDNMAGRGMDSILDPRGVMHHVDGADYQRGWSRLSGLILLEKGFQNIAHGLIEERHVER